MAEKAVGVSLYFLCVYASIGLLFALAFVSRGVQKIDRQAAGTGLGFRLLIFPGVVAFWPFLFKRWIRATGEPPTERNPHR